MPKYSVRMRWCRCLKNLVAAVQGGRHIGHQSHNLTQETGFKSQIRTDKKEFQTRKLTYGTFQSIIPFINLNVFLYTVTQYQHHTPNSIR
jgi:hypothetical protein